MRALGWDAGELRTGMLADFVTLQRDDAERREISLAQLIYTFSGRDVTSVVVGGETVIQK
jgi:cytosine/adenosine deaminase-related metal-dependent hydrolase